MDHINIVVRDMDRALEFYVGTLGLRRGFETTLEGPWIAEVTGLPGARARCVFVEPEAGARIELLQYEFPRGEEAASAGPPNAPGLGHVALLVDDLDAAVARLKAAGVSFISPPVEVPFAVGAMGRKRLCYFHDPEGNLLEIASYGP